MLFVARDVLERRRGREFVDNHQVTERRGVFVRQVLEHDDGRGCPARGRGKGCQQGQEAQRRGLARRRYQREVGQPRWLQVLVGRARKMKDSDASSSHTPLATDAAFMTCHRCMSILELGQQYTRKILLCFQSGRKGGGGGLFAINR